MENIVEILKKEFGDLIVGIKKINKKDPIFDDFKFFNEEINKFLNKINIKLYKHQKETLELLYNGKNVVVTTPTASGKSHIFRLYIMDNYLKNQNKTYLLIYPLRALLYDQFEKFQSLINQFNEIFEKKINLKFGILLGDLTYKEKEKLIKDKPNVILTTIDNLHLFLLKNHGKMYYFFRNLDLIVVDELHSYRGVFGTNSAYVFKRLIYLLKYLYKNNFFKFLALSATLKNPKEFAKKLFSLDFYTISEDYSKRYDRWVIGIDTKNIGPKVVLKRLIRILLENDIKSLVFLESKKGVERYKMLIEDLEKSNLVFTYKASYLKDIRKEIEKKFKNNEYRILITTSALELGIDIGDVSAVANYGIPRDGIFSLIQRFGRSGRTSNGLNIIIFKKDALDLYYSSNFEELFEKIEKNDIEELPINLDNEKIREKHLLYMIHEFGRLPLDLIEEKDKEILKRLIEKNYIKIIKDSLFGKEYVIPIRKVIYSGLRNISDKIYYLIDISDYEIVKNIKREETAFKIANMLKSKGKIIEEVDEIAFYEYLLPGMVYYSLGKAYRSVSLVNIGNINFVIVQKEESGIETEPIYNEEVKIIEKLKEKKFGDWKINLGIIEVNREYLGYVEKIKYGEEYMQNIIYYDNTIKRKFITKAIWIEIPKEYETIEREYLETLKKKISKIISEKKYPISFEDLFNFSTTVVKDYFYEKYRGLASRKIKEIVEKFLLDLRIKDKKLAFYIKKLIDSQTSFRSGLHAIEHNIIKISPIVTYIDSRELGGFSYPIHSQTQKPTIFIYEGFENGVGLAEIIFENIEKLILESKKSLISCKCLDGCPKCVFSSKCGNFNEYLDKYSARLIYKKFFKNIKDFK
ncbi:MAG: DEAD/DEAH box helicase [Nanopusillaceae archaeon]